MVPSKDVVFTQQEWELLNEVHDPWVIGSIITSIRTFFELYPEKQDFATAMNCVVSRLGRSIETYLWNGPYTLFGGSNDVYKARYVIISILKSITDRMQQ